MIMKLTIRLIIALLVSSNALLSGLQTPYNPTQVAQRQAYETELNNPQSLVNSHPELVETKILLGLACASHLHEYIPRYLDKGVRIPKEYDAKMLCEHLLYANDETPALLATFKHIQRKGPVLSKQSLYKLLESSYDLPTCTQLLLNMAGPQLESPKLAELLKSGLDNWCLSTHLIPTATWARNKKSYTNRSQYCALLINAGAQVPPLERFTAKLSPINATYLSTLIQDSVQLKKLNASLPLFHQNSRLFFNKVPGELIKELKSFIFEMLTTRTVSEWWRTSGNELEEINRQASTISSTK